MRIQVAFVLMCLIANSSQTQALQCTPVAQAAASKQVNLETLIQSLTTIDSYQNNPAEFSVAKAVLNNVDFGDAGRAVPSAVYGCHVIKKAVKVLATKALVDRADKISKLYIEGKLVYCQESNGMLYFLKTCDYDLKNVQPVTTNVKSKEAGLTFTNFEAPEVTVQSPKYVSKQDGSKIKFRYPTESHAKKAEIYALCPKIANEVQMLDEPYYEDNDPQKPKTPVNVFASQPKPALKFKGRKITGDLHLIPNYFSNYKFIQSGSNGIVAELPVMKETPVNTNANDPKNYEIVALKQIDPEGMSVEELRLTKELSLKKGLNFIDCFSGKYHVYLATKLLTIPLDDPKFRKEFAKERRTRRLEFYSEMSTAVAEFAAKGYVHNDVKPENFMVDEEDNVYLIDYGLAQKTGEKTAKLGSTAYVSPKRFQAKVAGSSNGDPSHDSYSLAVTFMAMETRFYDELVWYEWDEENNDTYTTQISSKKYPCMPETNPKGCSHFHEIFEVAFPSDDWGETGSESDFNKMSFKRLMKHIVLDLQPVQPADLARRLQELSDDYISKPWRNNIRI